MTSWITCLAGMARGLGKRDVSPESDVFINIAGVNQTDVAQGNLLLLLVKGYARHSGSACTG